MALDANRARILRATLIALAAAAALTVLVILPAEYGKDPTGFGRLTGLDRLAETRADAPAATPAAAGGQSPAVADASGKALPLSVWGSEKSTKFELRKYSVALQGDEELEYKALMQRGDVLLHSWRVKQGTPVYFEFHGEPTEGTWPEGYYESYLKGDGASGGQGELVAPFTGHHGWYWLNLSEKPIVIEVELAGYFSDFAKVEPAPFPEPPPEDPVDDRPGDGITPLPSE